MFQKIEGKRKSLIQGWNEASTFAVQCESTRVDSQLLPGLKLCRSITASPGERQHWMLLIAHSPLHFPLL